MGRFGERGRSVPDTFDQRLLARLYRETIDAGRRDAPFVGLCDRASIPRDLRAALLADLERRQLVTREGEQIRLTERGRRRAIDLSAG